MDDNGFYTREEIEQFAKSQNCTFDEFSKRWIIQVDDSFYVFANGKYLTPPLRKNGGLHVSLLRDLAAAPIVWTKIAANGNVRDKKLDELLMEHATVAREVKASLVERVSHYTTVTQTFTEAAAPFRNITPRYNAQVDAWLTHLGGEAHEKLKDWIATVRLLNKQCCALYLVGPPNSGKTVLTHGLARLWTTGAPSTLEGALSSFNDELSTCPLIVADEQISGNFRGEKKSAQLRALIGSNSRKLKRKFLPVADLVGAIRLILCANNDSLLDFDEELSPEDLDAVASRFLCVRVPPEARSYIEYIGGRTATEKWVDGDVIAAHTLWLEQNRKVEPGSRFVVEGVMTRMLELLPTRTKWTGMICEWLARHLNEPNIQVNSRPGRPIIGNGKYLINSNTLVDCWDTYVRNRGQTPSLQTIGFSLRPLRLGTKSIQGSRYHVINTALLLKWADEHQVGNLQQMQTRIDSKIALVK